MTIINNVLDSLVTSVSPVGFAGRERGIFSYTVQLHTNKWISIISGGHMSESTIQICFIENGSSALLMNVRFVAKKIYIFFMKQFMVVGSDTWDCTYQWAGKVEVVTYMT